VHKTIFYYIWKNWEENLRKRIEINNRSVTLCCLVWWYSSGQCHCPVSQIENGKNDIQGSKTEHGQIIFGDSQMNSWTCGQTVTWIFYQLISFVKDSSQRCCTEQHNNFGEWDCQHCVPSSSRLVFCSTVENSPGQRRKVRRTYRQGAREVYHAFVKYQISLGMTWNLPTL
jgi:hypothetical protein